MELFGKSWWGKMLIASHRLVEFCIVDPCKPFKIEGFEGTSHSEAKPHQNLAKLRVAREKVGGAELKVGGAAASPTV